MMSRQEMTDHGQYRSEASWRFGYGIESAYIYSDDRSLLLVAMKPNSSPFSSKVQGRSSESHDTKTAHSVHR